MEFLCFSKTHTYLWYMTIKTCPVCKKEKYYKYNRNIDLNKPCRECNYKPKPNTKCVICGKLIYRVPSRMTSHPFCSYGCRNKYFCKENSFCWKGGEKESIKRGRLKDKERKLKRKLKCIEILGGKCQRCGYDKCIDAFDFHHKNPMEKDDTIKNLWGKTWPVILKEIEKCILLCSNCHRELHWKERQDAR